MSWTGSGSHLSLVVLQADPGQPQVPGHHRDLQTKRQPGKYTNSEICCGGGKLGCCGEKHKRARVDRAGQTILQVKSGHENISDSFMQRAERAADLLVRCERSHTAHYRQQGDSGQGALWQGSIS